MYNNPPPKKYNFYSPLFARVFALFDTLEDKHHHVAFDTAWFCRAAYVDHPMKQLTHGVTRKGGRRIPSCVQQEEITKKDDLDRVRGIVKVAKLEVDPECSCLIASSVYDTNPVHYLNMVSDMVKWIVKEKSV